MLFVPKNLARSEDELLKSTLAEDEDDELAWTSLESIRFLFVDINNDIHWVKHKFFPS